MRRSMTYLCTGLRKRFAPRSVEARARGVHTVHRQVRVCEACWNDLEFGETIFAEMAVLKHDEVPILAATSCQVLTSQLFRSQRRALDG